MLRYKWSNPSTGPFWMCTQHSTQLRRGISPSLTEAVLCVLPGLRVDLGTLLSHGFMHGGGGVCKTSVIQEAPGVFSNSSWMQRCVVRLAMIIQVQRRMVTMAFIWGLFSSGGGQRIADLKKFLLVSSHAGGDGLCVHVQFHCFCGVNIVIRVPGTRWCLFSQWLQRLEDKGIIPVQLQQA